MLLSALKRWVANELTFAISTISLYSSLIEYDKKIQILSS